MILPLQNVSFPLIVSVLYNVHNDKKNKIANKEFCRRSHGVAERNVAVSTEIPAILERNTVATSDEFRAPLGKDNVAERDVAISDEILALLGKNNLADQTSRNDLNNELAQIWSKILQEGLSPEVLTTILSKYSPLSNLSTATAPKLNLEILSVLTEQHKQQDLRLVKLQDQMGAALVAIGKALIIHLEKGEGAHTRILVESLSNVTVDGWLFGQNLGDRLKAAREMEKLSSNLKPKAVNARSTASVNFKSLSRANVKADPNIPGKLRASRSKTLGRSLAQPKKIVQLIEPTKPRPIQHGPVRALQKISGKLLELGLEMCIKDIKMKIQNLRATYCQELSKIEKSTRSGAGSKDEYKSKLNWFDEMHSFIKCVPMKRKTMDSQESAIDEEQDNSQMSQANIENSKEHNIDNSNDNSDNSEDVANSENFSPRPSTSVTGNIPQRNESATPTAKTTSKSNYKMSTPTQRKRKIAEVTSLVREIKSIKDDLNSTSTDEHSTPQQNEHDIFGTFVSSQLKMLSTARAIMARDKINAIFSQFRMEDLNCIKTTFTCKTPSSHCFSDSHTTINTVQLPLTSGDSVLSIITENEDDCQRQNPIDEINFDFLRQDNENTIAVAFRNA
ncbi:unnamed protein product [Acanthoscelides obtectus]|uniref:Uncharacterized protein n=1 Tax=Acanthoscelides obtectus TaxID=200917 RepID=A0A9P0KRB6_ACAOB|nr:unnamed protein product [Acanthoscelides obtectus]CAK1623730.1 hypothetical protein AOBTE_LOCUS2140 [Acanthoscelides obtectus]